MKLEKREALHAQEMGQKPDFSENIWIPSPSPLCVNIILFGYLNLKWLVTYFIQI